jgi:epoxyqueuosine reductase QueG
VIFGVTQSLIHKYKYIEEMTALDAEINTNRIRKLFTMSAKKYGLRGIIGITSFKSFNDSLMNVQKKKLQELSGNKFQSFQNNGKVVSIAYAYPNGIIDFIDKESDGRFDKDSWNIYAKWYSILNDALNKTSIKLAEKLDGISIPATFEGKAKLSTVNDYFPNSVNHRAHAEKAGIGWIGKNNLIINPVYGCAIRLSAILTEQPLVITSRLDQDCGDCSSCYEVCIFLKRKDKLDDYREKCRRYLHFLGLDAHVCGKCIKACILSPRLLILKQIPEKQELEKVFYTK